MTTSRTRENKGGSRTDTTFTATTARRITLTMATHPSLTLPVWIGATMPRMQIMLNGSPRDCAQGITVAQLLAEAGYGERRVAVEVNREIVPRSMHIRYALSEGDHVEIVHAIGGG